MKIRTILGLAAIGGVAYAHKQRGGTFTLESRKESGRAFATNLVEQAKKAIGPVRNEAKAIPRSDTSTRETYAETQRRFEDDNLH